MMSFKIQSAPIPLRTDEYGTLRIGDSQVLLDVVLREFNNGASAEEIAHAYSTLQLADVYAVIGYYLRNRQEVDAYLQTRSKEAERLRQEIESNPPDRTNLRAKLLARQAQSEQGEGRR